MLVARVSVGVMERHRVETGTLLQVQEVPRASSDLSSWTATSQTNPVPIRTHLAAVKAHLLVLQTLHYLLRMELVAPTNKTLCLVIRLNFVFTLVLGKFLHQNQNSPPHLLPPTAPPNRRSNRMPPETTVTLPLMWRSNASASLRVHFGPSRIVPVLLRPRRHPPWCLQQSPKPLPYTRGRLYSLKRAQERLGRISSECFQDSSDIPVGGTRMYIAVLWTALVRGIGGTVLPM